MQSRRPFLPPPWITTDDRLRNGSSRSFLTALPNNGALFYGNLDTATLGGAGFASQYSPITADDKNETTSFRGTLDDGERIRSGGAPWDLTAFAGLEIRLGKGDGKLYTLILKDAETSGRGSTGREEAGFNWEAEFRANNGLKEEDQKNDAGQEKKEQAVWLSWEDFKPIFRGRESDRGEKLDRSNIATIGIMMRSYFGTQEGDFRLELQSIAAWEETPGEQVTGKQGKNET